MEFTVRVPSYLYANQTEGLCGVCAGYQAELITSNGTTTDDFDEVSYQRDYLVLSIARGWNADFQLNVDKNISPLNTNIMVT